MQKRWDIFCAVIDNYGDAGVCWRLARQLATEFDLSICLWIDDLVALQKLQPAISLQLDSQRIENIEIRGWAQAFPEVAAADVVIEAFACQLPAIYLEAMRVQHSLWINLEYLSAETWAADCHGLSSPQTDGALQKFFFFPGFSANTGGVLGERDLRVRCRAFQTDGLAKQAFLQRCGVDHISDNALLISLFSYRDAPIQTLLKIWRAQENPVICFVPEGQPLLAVSKFFGEELQVGDRRQAGGLTMVVLPFLSQTDYDYLLWCCDLNFVRGEDSFVRAQWAGRAFVWQIYAQPERAHWPKLDAFLQLYRNDLSAPAAAALTDFSQAWNGTGDMAAAWSAFANALPELQIYAERWADRLDSSTNLAAALVQFCANRV